MIAFRGRAWADEMEALTEANRLNVPFVWSRYLALDGGKLPFLFIPE